MITLLAAVSGFTDNRWHIRHFDILVPSWPLLDWIIKVWNFQNYSVCNFIQLRWGDLLQGTAINPSILATDYIPQPDRRPQCLGQRATTSSLTGPSGLSSPPCGCCWRAWQPWYWRMRPRLPGRPGRCWVNGCLCACMAPHERSALLCPQNCKSAYGIRSLQAPSSY
jgi:hypothetical protein